MKGWVYITIFFIATLVTDITAVDELVFLQVVWRHGDRTPMFTFPNDNNTEDAWRQGWGELLPAGMARHVKLGQLMRQEYIDNHKFLSNVYRQQEIYVRSTDRNRTIISAISNLIGMYYNSSNPGDDYPEDSGTVQWPKGYIPIAVHTIAPSTEHILDPLTPCDRHDWLYSFVKKTPEYLALQEANKDLLANVSILIGKNITLQDTWWVRDAVGVEMENNKSTVFDDFPDLYEQFATVKYKVDNMEDGLDVSSYSNINFPVEISKIRGGGILWDMINHFDNKKFCKDGDSTTTEWKNRCPWIQNLKYYAYSAHDNTITALLTTLNAKEQIIPFGYPDYAAALALELWKLDNGTYVIKMRFHDSTNYTNGFVDVTEFIKGCESAKDNNQYCLYDTIRTNAYDYYPGDYDVLCADLNSTSTDMHQSSTSTTTTTTTTTTTATTTTTTTTSETSSTKQLSTFLLATVIGVLLWNM